MQDDLPYIQGTSAQQDSTKCHERDADALEDSSIVGVFRALKGTVGKGEGGDYRINDMLFKHHGVRAVIYRNRNNLGVVRRPFETVRMDHPEVLAVITKAGEQHEWFAHPSGFLYCRGSYKAPARSRSTVHPMDLVHAIDYVLSKS